MVTVNLYLTVATCITLYDTAENYKIISTLNGYIVVYFFNCACTGVCDSPAGFWFSTTSAGGIPQKDAELTVFLMQTHLQTCTHTSHKQKVYYNCLSAIMACM